MVYKMEVYSPGLELLGILETYSSILIENWAFKAGSFSIESILTDETKRLLVPDNFIWFGERMAGRIEYVFKENTNLSKLTVKGNLLKQILDSRVLMGLYNLKDTVPKMMAFLVDDCCLHPTRGRSNRVIPNLVLADIPEIETKVSLQKTGGYLLETLTGLGSANQVFFDVEFNPHFPRMEFVTRVGVNRTIYQSQVEQVFFGTELDDILESSYLYNSQDYRTAAFVAGEGEGEERTYLEVFKPGTEELSGLNLRELWVDARDLQTEVAYDEPPLSEEEYKAVLANRGQEKLAEHPLVQNFESSVRDKNATYVFGKDFFLGDTLTVIDKKLEVTVDALVEGVNYSVVNGVENVGFTFGYSAPTLYDKLKKGGT